MKCLGLMTVLSIYGCLLAAAISSRKGWLLLSGWLVPVFAMTVNFQEDMQINGLMALLCILLFLLCRRGMSEILLWNVRTRKKSHIRFCILYICLLLPLIYVFAQAQIQGYLLDIQGWNLASYNTVRMGIGLLVLCLMNIGYTRMAETAIDRMYGKKQELRLLQCHSYITSEAGSASGIHSGYYLEGIQNGITYYFRMTRHMFFMLRGEPKLILQVRRGLLGGLYVTQQPNCQWLSRIEKMKKREEWYALFGGILTLLLWIWLFWFR